MKTYYFLFLCIALIFNKFSEAQIKYLNEENKVPVSFLFSIGGGYDVPKVNNGIDKINYNGSVIANIAISRLWKWSGLGIDFDYVSNGISTNYPVDSKFFLNNTTRLTSYSLEKSNLRRVIFGVGPDLKIDVLKGVFLIDLALRAGVASIEGGNVLLKETTTSKQDILLFHSGYHSNIVFSNKARFSVYFFPKNKKVGFSLGAYYIKHHQLKESIDPKYGKSAILQTYTYNETLGANILSEPRLSRVEICNCEASSYGAHITLTYRILSE